ncbi:MAG: HU family DNA-binding protein [bacterium]|nr:HU family DNA-binding protein [bacterium]
MNKAELIDVLATKVEGLSKKQAEGMIETLIETVTHELKKGGELALTGFGTFSAKKRAARVGINPQTKAKIQIPAVTVPKFKAGKTLKDALK